MPRIKSIKFSGHQVFGTAEFDFCDNSGAPAMTIVLAGENGSGKTKLLKELYSGTKREYSIDAPVRDQHRTTISLDLSDSSYYVIDSPSTPVTEARLISSSDSDSSEEYYRVEFYHNDKLISHVGEKNTIHEVTKFTLNSAYSGTDINYIPRKPVKSVTDLDLDSGELYESEDVARDVTQLLIDVASQDNDDIAFRVSQHPELSVPKSLRENLRMNRFSQAFRYMFGDDLKYKAIRDNIRPVFEKDGKEVPLDSLSSGEKQIVFRGTYLVRNIKNLTGCPIFIDEPELSMHPKWARRIYGYYKSLFLDQSGVKASKTAETSPALQTSQIFIATHNEYVVASALADDSSLILDICIDCGSYHKFSSRQSGEILPTTSLAEIKYLVFKIYSPDFHIQLYAYIQNHYAKIAAVRGIDDYLMHHKAPKKKSTFKSTASGRTVTYHALPTYIRNSIDHPDQDMTYTEEELECSIEWMVNFIKTHDPA